MPSGNDPALVTLIIAGPEGTFYAIPVEHLDASYRYNFTDEKRARFDSLSSQSANNGRAVTAFYHDKVADGESSALIDY